MGKEIAIETTAESVISGKRPHKTRAEIQRDKVKIRLAVNSAGPLIAEVLKANGIELHGSTWNSVFPNWLIATVEDEVIGCCQVLIAKPVGFVEFLMVKPNAPYKQRAIAIRKLIIQSMATLKLAGVDYVGAVLNSGNKKFADVLEKLTFRRTLSAVVLAKRLAD